MNIKLTNRQSKAYKLALNGEKRVIVFGGAIRGGKTWWLLITLSALALKLISRVPAVELIFAPVA